MPDRNADPIAVTHFCKRIADGTDENLNQISLQDRVVLLLTLHDLREATDQALRRLRARNEAIVMPVDAPSSAACHQN